ncbi:MAG: helix-turn-helix domain-containing protein, partial [Acidimicrobiales bacterium]|nr:helix-turn-helix domain-containing protein [Acidimicrobiales bacterium]
SLSPIERTIVRLHNQGAPLSEIATRIGKKPGTVARIMEMTRYRVHGNGSVRQQDGVLRPLERTVLRLRERGESYGEIGIRLARSSRRVREIEKYAHFKLSEARA